MIEISVNGLKKSFEIGSNILDGLTFQVETGERVGLLGRNGAGKSTLFRILTGELEADEGDVVIAKNRRLGLISQIPVYPGGYTVDDVLHTAFARHQKLAVEMERLTAAMAGGDSSEQTLKRYGELAAKFEGIGGYDTDTAVGKVANGLSISKEMRAQLFDSLSGGEKTRVNLGRLILEDTDILLLDEPTNHLDLHAVEWLEDYVRHFKGTVVVISHDRYFLDRTINRVIEVCGGKAEFYPGNYSFYAIEKERRYLEKLRRYQKEQAEIQRLTETATKMHEHGTELLHKRAFSIERRIERIRQTEKPVKARTMTNRFGEKEFFGDEVMHIKDMSKAYGERILFGGVDLRVEGGERIALIGDNGTGKSTLLKILMNEEQAGRGSVKYGPTVRTAYLPQIIRFDNPDRNLVDTMLYAKRGMDVQTARNRLGAFNFRGEDVFKPVSVLSGGEQSRLRLCMLMDEEINLLVLDEPTNHLDIDSREWIEEAVEAYEGTLLFVSHDRYFINRFATRVWELENGVITDYPVPFGRYREIKEREKLLANSQPQQKIGKKADKPKGNKLQQTARKQLAICERDMEKLEASIKALEADLEANACDYEKYSVLYAQKEALDAQLAELMEHWERLAEEAEG
ncbi:MAG: ABC-F family ATP-binding cassette domain-containing protein [Oscillospiraceae bacterium]|nr:ABC-F family ATP-binding cassette domain-containing protein [Oscillospiraceae bacterium]